MNMTKTLVNEHKNILKVSDSLIREAEKIDSGEEADKEFFEAAVFFIRNYADKFHHAKEEEILFKEICKKESDLHCNPVQQMLFEHDEGRKFVKGIEQGLKEKNRKKISESARVYAQLIREHIFKEDNILYPMAEQAFDTKTKKEIVERFFIADKKAKQSEIKCMKIMGSLK